jgi:hypothetical protein
MAGNELVPKAGEISTQPFFFKSPLGFTTLSIVFNQMFLYRTL